MKLNWSLKELYTSFHSDDFKNDLEKLDNMIKYINEWVEDVICNTKEISCCLEEYIKNFSDFEKLTSKLNSFIELSLSVNTNDKEALRYSGILEKKFTLIVAASTKIKKWISEISNLEEEINKSKLLKEHEFILKELADKSKYLLTDKEETIISNMKNTGSKAWLKLKDSLISNLKVEIEENNQIKELPLTVVLNMAYSDDKNVRKKGYEAEIMAYKKVEEGVAAALNGIKGEVITVAELRGYDDPLDMTLKNSRMDLDSLNAMLDATKESLPHFRKYLRKKAEMLGYKKGLPFYEMYAPVSKATMKFSYEEATEFIYKNFKTFSDNLSNYAKRVVDNSWVDVMPKEGKVGGAFCAGLHPLGQSRILLNFDGNFGDVVTLAHELGHGFHGECLKNESILNTEYTMPIAETASNFCEIIVKKAALKEATKDEALTILETEISDCCQVVVDIYSRFLFEKSIFDRRKESALSVEEIKELMIKAQKEAYGDGLDQDFLHPYMWTWKPHYYDVDYNYYNFPYAFGLLFAKGLYSEYLREGEKFPNEYEKILSITGKNKIADITKVVGIDINNKEFWKNSLKLVEEDINEFLKY